MAELTLNKKHSSVAYHFARWKVATSMIRTAWVPRGENLADSFTKLLPSATRDYLFIIGHTKGKVWTTKVVAISDV